MAITSVHQVFLELKFEAIIQNHNLSEVKINNDQNNSTTTLKMYEANYITAPML